MDTLDIENIELIEETDKYYRFRNKEDGNEFKAIKINPKEIEDIHQQTIDTVAKLSKDSLHVLMGAIQQLAISSVSIDEYEDVANNLTGMLKVAYDEIGKPNQLYHEIKYIDPSIYGKAQTFTKRIIQFGKFLNEVAEAKEIEFRIDLGVDDGI